MNNIKLHDMLYLWDSSEPRASSFSMFLRQHRYKGYPSFAKASARAAPIPLEAPVMRAGFLKLLADMI